MLVTITEIAELSDASACSFVAATSLGSYISSDSGLTWRPLETSQAIPTFAIGALRTQDDTEVLFAGNGGGLTRSLDSSRSWQLVLVSSPVTAMAMGVNRSGTPITLIGTESDGIFRSTDIGDRWLAASPGLLDFEVLVVQMSPNFSVDNTVFTGTASGLYRSRNGGEAWRPILLPEEECPVQCIAFHPQYDDVPMVWAGTEATGLLVSVDGGTNWAIDKTLGRVGVSSIVVSRHNPALILVATDKGIYRSLNTGESWSLAERSEDVICLRIFGQSEEILLAGRIEQGILRSSDSGETWEAAKILPIDSSTD
jgi:photosystem II stability/assembly factor-like uncharacterized protein